MEAPKLPSMFGIKTRRPNQFYFEPRYYNEKKEKMKKRYERIGKEIENERGYLVKPIRNQKGDFEKTI